VKIRSKLILVFLIAVELIVIIGFLLILQSSKEALAANAITLLTISTIVILALVISLFFIFSNSVTRSISKLIVATNEISKGNYDTKIEIKEGDEISELQKSFNLMAESLQKSTILLSHTEQKYKNLYDELQKLSLLKDDFLAMITHELKTPLVPIKGYIDILMSEKIGPINEEQKKKLEIVSSSTRSLLRLISDLLDAQKIELGQLKLNKDVHDLAEIVTNSVNKMKPDADQYGITITTDLGNPIPLVCDNVRIEQVLSNLIANSLDFCPKQNGKINIKLFSENRHVGIIVKDNGIGIAKESLDKIFVKFYQVDTSTTREHGGTGVGLSVCKGIVEGHAGKIWAESDGRDKGAEIHILLPGIK